MKRLLVASVKRGLVGQVVEKGMRGGWRAGGLARSRAGGLARGGAGRGRARGPGS